jgi:hypothetical protein
LGELFRFLFFFGGSLVLVSLQAFISSLSYEAGFYKLTVLKVHPPFSGLQYMQQCQVNLHSFFCFHSLIQMNGA